MSLEEINDDILKVQGYLEMAQSNDIWILKEDKQGKWSFARLLGDKRISSASFVNLYFEFSFVG